MDKLQVLSASSLAEVQTPTGAVWYIPYAQRRGDFVVQRRYRRAGRTSYTLDEEEKIIWDNAWEFVAHLAPFLNPGAVRAAGLDLVTILNQLAEDPEQIFTHPTYAQLCLRWGENIGGYAVREQVPEPLPDDMAVPFSPHTCWLTGTTYYRLDFATQNEVFETLLRAGLRAHEQEIGLEGNWSGWYVTDLNATRRVLAESGQYPVVTCAQVWYGLQVVERPANISHLVRAYTTPEEAFALYQQVRELSAESATPTWTFLHYGRVVQWPGRALEWQILGEKEVASEHASQLLAGKTCGMYALQALPKIITHDALAEIDWPLAPRVITLRERLDTITLSRSDLARYLKWDLAKLVRRERNLEELTLAEVQQLAQMLAMQEEVLFQELRKEMRARRANREIEQRYAAVRLASAEVQKVT